MNGLKKTITLCLMVLCPLVAAAQSIEPVHNRKIFSAMTEFGLNQAKDSIVIKGHYRIRKLKVIDKSRRVITYQVNDTDFKLDITGLKQDFYIVEVYCGGHRAKFVLYGSDN